MSYQFRRGLGETQEGGGTVSECFLAASRMIPGDKESWHREWMRIADFNQSRGDEEFGKGHIRTAMNCWLRAANYYRQTEFWLEYRDPRRLEAFTNMEECSRNSSGISSPTGEVLQIPYENGKTLFAYFVRAPLIRQAAVLICMGGLDSIKDEMWFMQAHGALQRGISVLMIDGPGQGGTLRRHGIPTRPDYEVPIGKCIDYLATRRMSMRHASPSAARAWAAITRRAPAVTSIVSRRRSPTARSGRCTDLWASANEDHGLADAHQDWVFGASSMKEAMEKAAAVHARGPSRAHEVPLSRRRMAVTTCSAVPRPRSSYDYAQAKGVDVTLRFVTEEETGAEHCQHDNPTIGQELMADWLADVSESTSANCARRR